jgi:hypothetical protein
MFSFSFKDLAVVKEVDAKVFFSLSWKKDLLSPPFKGSRLASLDSVCIDGQ